MMPTRIRMSAGLSRQKSDLGVDGIREVGKILRDEDQRETDRHGPLHEPVQPVRGRALDDGAGGQAEPDIGGAREERESRAAYACVIGDSLRI